MTEFFVPGAADAAPPYAGPQDAGLPDADEAAYRRLAELAGAAPAESGRRIRQVAFKVGRESWTAEVGRKMAGTRPEHRRRKGEFTTTTEKLSGPAVVLAIFDGTPFSIVTDAEPATSAPAGSETSAPEPSSWPILVLVDKPSRVAYFAD
ncbi:hypothetical protein ABIB15_001664 [Marisediminicola sp. UYEF4]|uniref:hypothetical protein n=1 Tax=Marisediminicola sp. UYEF4 TaxID=1756384 RepID=UPI00339A2F3E